MQDYDCLDEKGKVIGQVSASDGNTAWVFAQQIHGSKCAALRPAHHPRATKAA